MFEWCVFCVLSTIGNCDWKIVFVFNPFSKNNGFEYFPGPMLSLLLATQINGNYIQINHDLSLKASVVYIFDKDKQYILTKTFILW